MECSFSGIWRNVEMVWANWSQSIQWNFELYLSIFHWMETNEWTNEFSSIFNLNFLFFQNRSCIIGAQLEVKVCTLGTVINRTAYPSDYCHLEGTGRQSQPMPIRWMSWESVLLVSSRSSFIFQFSFFNSIYFSSVDKSYNKAFSIE